MIAFLRTLLHQPRKLWLRGALFQVHLWGGLILGLYILVIGLSGSILIFSSEIRQAMSPHLGRVRPATGPPLNLLTVAERVRAAYPGKPLSAVFAPNEVQHVPTFIAYVSSPEGILGVSVDPSDGRILGDWNLSRSWVQWMQFLHINLHSGNTGLIVNGVAAACMLLMALTGLAIWWPGIKRWTRALIVDFRRSWTRINLDLHTAAGFWMFLFVCMWAGTGIYFAWPRQFTTFVSRFSLAQTFVRPKLQPTPPGQRADVQAILADAHRRSRGARLAGVNFPRNPATTPMIVYMARKSVGDFSTTDYMYFNAASGDHAYSWRRGVNRTLGDWIVWSIIPLHYGTFWGWTVKIIWGVAGLMLPFLAITGAMMYWNRALSKRWRRFRRRRRQPQRQPGR